ncbi:hypothetical protein ACHRVW_17575 [Flavobacterium collinsii]|jgi:hypothetical protein|uniref:DUF937 domain-containing protein n=1 Tax=Flavobacterium collinsii TaxID=1114861 RepID=A0A9W4X6S4_9FLAO|nr:hypothetical protein [Flavobacterium collinsii]GIQ60154.1 hypothetical protein Flavo103_32900 [Flavobacterium collinsii]CAA9199644.1 hypothetical protein FLACOL7796_02846 [Flavobacterium collinsii]CAI2767512.1 conserved protein of unknown function [Flavobacterium collinsii]
MFEQLTQLVQQYGGDAVVNNAAVPNEHNEAVIQETSSSIFSGLQKIASEGGAEQLAGLFNGTSKLDSSNPVVQQITQQLSGSLGEKFGLSSADSAGVASGMIPQVLSSLVNKAKDPNDSSFNISDIISSISGNSGQASGIMDTINKYGMQFGLDQNNDGKVDVADAMALTKSGGLGGLLGKLFGK